MIYKVIRAMPTSPTAIDEPLPPLFGRLVGFGVPGSGGGVEPSHNPGQAHLVVSSNSWKPTAPTERFYL